MAGERLTSSTLVWSAAASWAACAGLSRRSSANMVSAVMWSLRATVPKAPSSREKSSMTLGSPSSALRAGGTHLPAWVRAGTGCLGAHALWPVSSVSRPPIHGSAARSPAPLPTRLGRFATSWMWARTVNSRAAEFWVRKGLQRRPAPCAKPTFGASPALPKFVPFPMWCAQTFCPSRAQCVEGGFVRRMRRTSLTRAHESTLCQQRQLGKQQLRRMARAATFGAPRRSSRKFASGGRQHRRSCRGGTQRRHRLRLRHLQPPRLPLRWRAQGRVA